MPNETKETFAEYLARVGQDQFESGREFTAEDYQKASKRISELENVLNGIALILDQVVCSRNMDSTRQEFHMIRSCLHQARTLTTDRRTYLHLN